MIVGATTIITITSPTQSRDNYGTTPSPHPPPKTRIRGKYSLLVGWPTGIESEMDALVFGGCRGREEFYYIVDTASLILKARHNLYFLWSDLVTWWSRVLVFSRVNAVVVCFFNVISIRVFLSSCRPKGGKTYYRYSSPHGGRSKAAVMSLPFGGTTTIAYLMLISSEGYFWDISGLTIYTYIGSNQLWH